MSINVFLLFCSFVFLQIVCVRERERERERVYRIGYKEKWSQSLLIFFSLMEFLWRIFPLIRANRLYAVFNTGLKNLAPSCPRYFLSSSTRSTCFGSVCYEPCPTTNFSYYLFPLTGRSPYFRFGVPANRLASTFFFPVSGDPLGLLYVTQVRLLSTDSLP